MMLVVDSNIVFSALIAPMGKVRELIFKKELELFAPQLLLEEIKKHKDEIIKKSGLGEELFEVFLIGIKEVINFVPLEELVPFAKIALDCCPDEDDSIFFALCLAKEIPLWSNDKALKNQEVVRVLNTSEVLELVEGSK